MTFRPLSQSVSRREAIVYNKAVRAFAHKECMTAHEALNKLAGYRTHHYRDRIRADGLFYVSHVQLDDGTLPLDDGDVYDFKIDFPAHEEPRRQTNMTVSLLDIAKPARRKVRGKKKSGTLTVDRARGVDDYEFEDFIELDHSDAFSIFSEDWEDVYSEDNAEHEEVRTYSSVLRGEVTTEEDPPPVLIDS